MDQKYHYCIEKFNRNIGIDFKVNSNPNPSPLPLPNDHYAHLTHINPNPNPNPGRWSIIINIRSIYKSIDRSEKTTKVNGNIGMVFKVKSITSLKMK